MHEKSADTTRGMLWISLPGEAYYVTTGSFFFYRCIFGVFLRRVIFSTARWNKIASNPQRSVSTGIMIRGMLTDKKVIGLSGRGESITLQQQRYVSLFGKSSTAIIDSQSISEA